jgi:hypothetical protein
MRIHRFASWVLVLAGVPACSAGVAPPSDSEAAASTAQALSACSASSLNGQTPGPSLVCGGAWEFVPTQSFCNNAQCPPDFSTINFSEPGISLSTFTNEYAGITTGTPQCTTCDDLAFDDPGNTPPAASASTHAQAKFDCIQSHLQDFNLAPRVGPWITTHTSTPPTIDASGKITVAGQIYQRMKGDGQITVAVTSNVGGVYIGGRSTVGDQPSAWLWQASLNGGMRAIKYEKALGPGLATQTATITASAPSYGSRQYRLKRIGNVIESWVLEFSADPSLWMPPRWVRVWSDSFPLPPVVDVGITSGTMQIVENTFQSADDLERTQLVSDLKLAYEVEGEALRPDQQKAAQALYATDDAIPACQANAFAGALDAACAAQTKDFQRKLALCERVTTDYVPAISSDINVAACDALAQTLPTCDVPVFAAEVHSLATALTKKSLTSYPLDMTGSADATNPTLQLLLRRISDWYAEAKAYEGGNPTQLWSDYSVLAGAFWTHVHSWAYAKLQADLGPSGTGDPAAGLSVLSTDVLDAERRVITAAFSTMGDGKPPLASAPLLSILGDSLSPVVERLDDAALFHDMGCRFAGCSGTAPPTSLVDAWRLLGVLADATALQKEVTASTLSAQWTAVFSAIQQQHAAAFEAAVDDAFGVTTYDPTLLAGPAPLLPPPAQRLASIVQEGTAYTNNFAKSGLLVDTGNDLHIGLTDEMLGTAGAEANNLTARIGDRTGKLTGDVTTYTANRTALVNALIQQMQNHASAQHLQDDEAQKNAQIQEMDDDIARLKLNFATDEATFGDFMDSFRKLVAAATDPNVHVQTSQTQLTVTPADATYSGSGAVVDVTPYSINRNPFPVALNKGDVLTISVSGTWSPTGALRDAVLDGHTVANAESASTGSEGFIITEQNGNYTAQQYTTTIDQTQSSVRPWGDCEEQRVDCKSSKSVSSSDQQTVSSTESASYAIGLHLPETPFPSLPAGSLLLFEADAVTGKGHDIRVLQAANAIVADTDMNLVLIVNDKASNGGGHLDLMVTRFQPLAGSLADKMGKAMADAAGTMRKGAEKLVGQGRMLPDDAAALRSSAMTALATDCACDLSTYPQPLHDAFTALVDKQIVQIEREVEIVSLTRQRDLLLQQLQQDQDDVASNGAQARVLTLVPGWALANMDGDQLRVSARNLLELVANDLYPAAEIRYPGSLTKMKADSHLMGELTQMASLDWQGPIDIVNLSNLAAKTASDIGGYFNDSAGASDPSAVATLGLAFANPAAVSPTKSQWLQADATRAAALWSVINGSVPGAPAVATVNVFPEDLYVAGSGLSCGDTAPVLVGSAFYVATADDTQAKNINGLGKWLPLNIGADQEYPTSQGVLPFRFAEDPDPNATKWLSDKKLDLYTGLSVNAVTTFDGYFKNVPNGVATTASGLSPFSRFDIDVNALKSVFPATTLSTAREIVLVMAMETKANGRVTGVSACK